MLRLLAISALLMLAACEKGGAKGDSEVKLDFSEQAFSEAFDTNSGLYSDAPLILRFPAGTKVEAARA